MTKTVQGGPTVEPQVPTSESELFQRPKRKHSKTIKLINISLMSKNEGLTTQEIKTAFLDEELPAPIKRARRDICGSRQLSMEGKIECYRRQLMKYKDTESEGSSSLFIRQLAILLYSENKSLEKAFSAGKLCEMAGMNYGVNCKKEAVKLNPALIKKAIKEIVRVRKKVLG